MAPDGTPDDFRMTALASRLYALSLHHRRRVDNATMNLNL